MDGLEKSTGQGTGQGKDHKMCSMMQERNQNTADT